MAASAGRLAGRSALVTGASRGIGLECARLLAAEGARVVLLARHRETLDEAVRSVKQGSVGVVCDVGDARARETALAEVRTALSGAPDIIVNNAGRFFLKSIEQTSLADFENALLVNLTAPFAVVHAFLPDLRARKTGHIVTIGSIADRQAFPENSAYAAGKYGLRALHEVLRQELRGTGVRATLVSPAPVDTAIWDEVNPDERPGFTPRAEMLPATAVAEAVRYAVTAPPAVNIDELRLSRS